MDLKIKGKKALVTGGASGIGQAIAIDLAKEGVQVVITSRKAEALQKTLQLMGGEKQGHLGILCEISEVNGPAEVYQEIMQKYGPVDILVNNVGSTQDITDPYCSLESWRKVFRLNNEVAIELNNFFIPYMKEKNWGRIVNITAGAGLENSGPVPYCASKAAMTAYTRSMGRVLAIESKNIVMTALLPGVVVTEGGHWDKVYQERPEHAEKYIKERCPLGRFGSTDEISPMVLYLCSTLATFNHGGIYLVDGGQARHYMYSTFLA